MNEEYLELIQEEMQTYSEKEYEEIYDIAFTFYRKIQNLYNLLNWTNPSQHSEINHKTNEELMLKSFLSLLQINLDVNEKKICVDLTIDNLEKHFLRLTYKDETFPKQLMLKKNGSRTVFCQKKMADYFLSHLEKTIEERNYFNILKNKINNKLNNNNNKSKFKI